jgi:hypothetical protein
VALAAEFSQRPKPIHGVELVGAIPSKFWARPGEQEDSVVEDDDLSEPSTPQFISQALDAGFTIDELSRAEKALDSGTTPIPSDVKLSKSIVSNLVQRKIEGKPWQGPLPSPRVSPPRTLGDYLATATYLRSQNRNSAPTSCSVPLLARSCSASSSRSARTPAGTDPASQYQGSKKFELQTP